MKGRVIKLAQGLCREHVIKICRSTISLYYLSEIEAHWLPSEVAVDPGAESLRPPSDSPSVSMASPSSP